MIALRYGTVPVVRSTGGLADTVKDVDHYQASCFLIDCFYWKSFGQPTKLGSQRSSFGFEVKAGCAPGRSVRARRPPIGQPADGRLPCPCCCPACRAATCSPMGLCLTVLTLGRSTQVRFAGLCTGSSSSQARFRARPRGVLPHAAGAATRVMHPCLARGGAHASPAMQRWIAPSLSASEHCAVGPLSIQTIHFPPCSAGPRHHVEPFQYRAFEFPSIQTISHLPCSAGSRHCFLQGQARGVGRAAGPHHGGRTALELGRGGRQVRRLRLLTGWDGCWESWACCLAGLAARLTPAEACSRASAADYLALLARACSGWEHCWLGWAKLREPNRKPELVLPCVRVLVA